MWGYQAGEAEWDSGHLLSNAKAATLTRECHQQQVHISTNVCGETLLDSKRLAPHKFLNTRTQRIRQELQRPFRTLVCAVRMPYRNMVHALTPDLACLF